MVRQLLETSRNSNKRFYMDRSGGHCISPPFPLVDEFTEFPTDHARFQSFLFAGAV